MGTSSSICIRNRDGSYTGIYCNYDGYLEYNGKILLEHYSDEAKLHKLMKLGDLSFLGAEIGRKHPFNIPEYGSPAYHAWKKKYHNWCNAYGRDRGETNCQCVTYPTLSEIMRNLGKDCDYHYVWENGNWRYARHGGVFFDLKECLNDSDIV
jgi:hypothetical protein